MYILYNFWFTILKFFRVGETRYEDYDANEILNGVLKWSSLKKKNGLEDYDDETNGNDTNDRVISSPSDQDDLSSDSSSKTSENGDSKSSKERNKTQR
jgi:hypothetical protein